MSSLRPVQPPRAELEARAVREEIASYLDDPSSDNNCVLLDAFIDGDRVMVFAGAYTEMGLAMAAARYGPDRVARADSTSVTWQRPAEVGNPDAGCFAYALIPQDDLDVATVEAGAAERLTELRAEPVNVTADLARKLGTRARIADSGFLAEVEDGHPVGTAWVDLVPDCVDSHEALPKTLKKLGGVTPERNGHDAGRYWETRVYGTGYECRPELALGPDGPSLGR